MATASSFHDCTKYDTDECTHKTDPAMVLLKMNFDKLMTLPEKLQGHVIMLCSNCTSAHPKGGA